VLAVNARELLDYLASGYSHVDPKVREFRFRQVSKTAAKMTAMGYNIFCPIVHCHPMLTELNLDFSFEAWARINRVYLSLSRMLFILDVEWEQSFVVSEEIKIAEEFKIPIFLVDEEGEIQKHL